MNANEDQQSIYNFCYCRKDFKSLVMLKRPQNIIDLILAREKRQIFWYASDHDFDILSIIENHPYDNVTVYWFTNVAEILNKFAQDNNLDNICLACSEDDLYSAQVQQIVRIANISTVCCYFISELTEQELKVACDGKSCMLAKSKLEVISNFYQRQCKYDSYKILPNFIAIKDVGASNVLIRTIYCMINQNIESDMREALVEELSDVFYKMIQAQSYYKIWVGDIERFIAELRDGNLSTERAIFWYTYESPIFKIINSFLRVSRFSTMTFYLQPYFKDLFLAIRKLFLQQNKKQQWVDFTCYRGGKIEESEVEHLRDNIGEIVQNLSFFSTSSSDQTAISYIINVHFEIKVLNDQLANEDDHDYGYAWIAKQSHFYQQQEIIFNPMCSFIVTDVAEVQQKYNKMYYIKMEYTKLNKLDAKSKVYKKYNALYQYQSQMKKSTIHQGNILINDAQNLDEAAIYWQKYLKLATNQQMTFEAYKVLSLIQKYRHGYQKSKTYIQKAFSQIDKSTKSGRYQYIQMIYYQTDLLKKLKKVSESLELCTNYVNSEQVMQHSDIQALLLEQLGDLYFEKGKFIQSLESYQKCLQIKNKIFGFDQLECTQPLNKIASIKRIFGQYQEAKRLLKYSQDILIDILGCEHLYYVNNLKQWATMYLAMENFQKANQLYAQCIKIEEKKKDITGLALTYIQTGCVWSYRGNQQNALKYFNMSLELLNATLNKQNVFSIWAFTRIAYLYKKQKKFNLALPLLDDAQKTIQKIYGKNNLQYLRTEFSKGSIYRNQGKYFDALKSLTECRLGFITCSYIYMGLYEEVITELASVYISLNMLDKAYGLLLELSRRPDYFPYQYFMAYTFVKFAYMSSKQKQVDQALQICRWIRSILKNSKSQADYLNFLISLGSIFHRLGSYIEARQLYINADQIFTNYSSQIKYWKPNYLQMLYLIRENLAKMGQKQSEEYRTVNNNLQMFLNQQKSYQILPISYWMDIEQPKKRYQKPQPIFIDFLQ